MPTLLELQNQRSVEALANLLRYGAAAGAAGVGFRSLQGLGNLMRRNLGKPPAIPSLLPTLQLPIPQAGDDEEEKRAEVQPPGVFEQGAQKILEAGGGLLQPGQSPTTAQSRFWGATSPEAWNKPYLMAAGIPLLAAAWYGGYKLTDLIMDAARKREQAAALEKARREYMEVVQGGYKQALDAAYATYEAAEAGTAKPIGLQKQSGGPGLNSALGLYGLLLTLSGGLGAYGGYQYGQSTSRTRALKEALKRRRAELAQQFPAPMLAVPQPYPAQPVKLAGAGEAAAQWLGEKEQQRQAAMQRAMEAMSGNKPKSAPKPAASPPAPHIPGLKQPPQPLKLPAAAA